MISPYEIKKVVSSVVELTTEGTYQDIEGKSYASIGLIVAVENTTDSDENGIYFLKDVDVTNINNWQKANEGSGGGGSVVVVQSTGTSTTSVMSQKAVTDSLNNKANIEPGKSLSTNDYTNADKTIVDNVSTNLDTKVDKVSGKGLSTNDYTAVDKAKVDAIPDVVQVTGVSTTDVISQKVVTDLLNTKVTSEAGKGLSTNDYTNEDKAAISSIADIPTVVQIKGTSTEDVMSQKSVSDNLDVLDTKIDTQVEELKEFYDTLKTDLYLYVDVNIGSDVTGTGEETNPYATLGKAISTVPKIVNSEVIIYVAKDTVNEVTGILLEDFSGSGDIKICAKDSADTFTINSLPLCMNCSLDIYLEQIIFTGRGDETQIFCWNVTGHFNFKKCVFNGTGLYHCVQFVNCTNVEVQECQTIGGGNGVSVIGTSKCLISSLTTQNTTHALDVWQGGTVTLLNDITPSPLVKRGNGGNIIYPSGKLGELADGGFLIYDNASGTNGTIAADFSGYSILKIFYYKDAGATLCQTIYSTSSTRGAALTEMHYWNDHGTFYFNASYINISNTTLVWYSTFHGTLQILADKSIGMTAENGLKITQIIGYKN